MQVDAQHRLQSVRFESSAHCDERPAWALIDLIVVHCVSLPEGSFGTGFVRQLFLGELDTDADPSFHDLRGLEVAPHLLIDRDGLVHQFVTFDKRAWHAGVSAWQGRSRCNDFAIGIELEGCVDQSFTSAQYDALVEVCGALLTAYPGLSVQSIVGHNEVAPGRKTDPGPGFDWAGFMRRLYDRA